MNSIIMFLGGLLVGWVGGELRVRGIMAKYLKLYRKELDSIHDIIDKGKDE